MRLSAKLYRYFFYYGAFIFLFLPLCVPLAINLAYKLLLQRHFSFSRSTQRTLRSSAPREPRVTRSPSKSNFPPQMDHFPSHFYSSFRISVFYLSTVFAELPTAQPVLWTDRDRYEPGHMLRANCSSPPSKPRVELRFTLNNIGVSF